MSKNMIEGWPALRRSVVFICFLALAVTLSLSTIGFSLSEFGRNSKPTKLQKLELDLNVLKSIAGINQNREETIKRIMAIIDYYNKQMPASLKFNIAKEIFEMDLKYDNLNVDLICATITHESAVSWDPQIVSGKGALGLMQIMPKTGKFLAEIENMPWTSDTDILFNPVFNIRLGCQYLSSLIEYYGVEGGLAAYNGGEIKAATWLANNKADGILWNETQKYVPAVLNLYNKYKN